MPFLPILLNDDFKYKVLFLDTSILALQLLKIVRTRIVRKSDHSGAAALFLQEKGQVLRYLAGKSCNKF